MNHPKVLSRVEMKITHRPEPECAQFRMQAYKLKTPTEITESLGSDATQFGCRKLSIIFRRRCNLICSVRPSHYWILDIGPQQQQTTKIAVWARELDNHMHRFFFCVCPVHAIFFFFLFVHCRGWISLIFDEPVRPWVFRCNETSPKALSACVKYMLSWQLNTHCVSIHSVKLSQDNGGLT